MQQSKSVVSLYVEINVQIWPSMIISLLTAWLEIKGRSWRSCHWHSVWLVSVEPFWYVPQLTYNEWVWRYQRWGQVVLSSAQMVLVALHALLLVHLSITFLASSSIPPVQWCMVNAVIKISFICINYCSFVICCYHLFCGVEMSFVRYITVTPFLMTTILDTRLSVVRVVEHLFIKRFVLHVCC